MLGSPPPDAEAAHARARQLAAALGVPLPGGAAANTAPASTAPASTAPASTAPASTAPALLLLECELLPHHARRQLPPPLWAGGAALPLLQAELAWLDTEALQLR